MNDMVCANAMAREVLRLRGPAEGLWQCAHGLVVASLRLKGPAHG